MAKTATKKPETASIEPAVIESKVDLERAIKEIGDLQREKNELENKSNATIQTIQEALASSVGPLDDRIKALSVGIKLYCDANRKTLIADGKKSADLLTGTIAYREKQPRVITKTTDKFVTKLLTQAGLVETVDRLVKKLRISFLRIKIELDKDAVLAAPEKAKEKGIEIENSIERFYVKPNVLDTELEVA